MSQGKFVVTRDSMLQQKVQPATRIKEDYVATRKEFVTTQSSVSAIQGNTTLSRQRKSLSRQRKSLSQQQIHPTGRNSIVTKIENNNKKNIAT